MRRGGTDDTGRPPGNDTSPLLDPSDTDLQQRVMTSLAHAVDGHAAYIGVAAHDGVVTLTGVVATNTVRLAARAAAAEVWGVQSLADDLDIEGQDPSRSTARSREDASPHAWPD